MCACAHFSTLKKDSSGDDSDGVCRVADTETDGTRIMILVNQQEIIITIIIRRSSIIMIII